MVASPQSTLGHWRSPRQEGSSQVAMTPMIDVVFLLLIFFLATSSFERVEKNLPSGISQTDPIESGAQPKEPILTDLDDIVIRLKQSNDNGPQIWINQDELPGWEELRARLREIVAIKLDIPIIVDPEHQVPIDQVIRAYDIARQSGALRVFLATPSS